MKKLSPYVFCTGKFHVWDNMHNNAYFYREFLYTLKEKNVVIFWYIQ